MSNFEQLLVIGIVFFRNEPEYRISNYWLIVKKKNLKNQNVCV
jgi:hypothetical protein